MYSTCIFCHANLGSNESIEHFPVGRRLAFDEARGRLWVVCRRCERWNLSPLEERWEAIEECGRLFAATRTRVSTDNIGLARVAGGLELVRIGSPQRPEMAAWRYGDQFGRRRTKHLLWTGAAVGSGIGLVLLGPATGLIAGGGWGLWNVANSLSSIYRQHRVRARLQMPDGSGGSTRAYVRLRQLSRVALVAEDESWSLRVPFVTRGTDAFAAWRAFGGDETTAVLRGDEALRVAGQLLPAINSSGARRAEVDDAVRMIGDAPDPVSLFARHASVGTRPRSFRRGSAADGEGRLVANFPKEVRLALEMATHEDSERRALEGELAVLEEAWRSAEEIAAIADDLFVPEGTRARLAELKEHE